MTHPIKRAQQKIKNRNKKILPKMKISGKSVFVIKKMLDKKNNKMN